MVRLLAELWSWWQAKADQVGKTVLECWHVPAVSPHPQHQDSSPMHAKICKALCKALCKACAGMQNRRSKVAGQMQSAASRSIFFGPQKLLATEQLSLAAGPAMSRMKSTRRGCSAHTSEVSDLDTPPRNIHDSSSPVILHEPHEPHEKLWLQVCGLEGCPRNCIWGDWAVALQWTCTALAPNWLRNCEWPASGSPLDSVPSSEKPSTCDCGISVQW